MTLMTCNLWQVIIKNFDKLLIINYKSQTTYLKVKSKLREKTVPWKYNKKLFNQFGHHDIMVAIISHCSIIDYRLN